MSRWKDGKPPKTKKCNGCGEVKDYKEDFYQFGRIRKDNSLAWYSIQPCISCMAKRGRRRARQETTPYERWKRKERLRRYQREYQRMRFTLLTGKRYNVRVNPKRDANPRIRLSSEPFFDWFEDYLERTGKSAEGVCLALELDPIYLKRARKDGYLSITTVEKFFVYAGEPHMLQVLYHGGEIQAEAA